MKYLLSITLAVAALPSCGSSNTPDAASALCPNLPANNAAMITDVVMTTPYPAPAAATGGTIETGTYIETGHIYYQPTTVPNHTWRGTMQIDVGAGTSAANISRDGAVFQQTTATFTTSAGGGFSLSFTCPATVAGTSASLLYSYAAGVLTIYTDADHTATVFHKQ